MFLTKIVHKIWICPERFLPVLQTFSDPGGGGGGGTRGDCGGVGGGEGDGGASSHGGLGGGAGGGGRGQAEGLRAQVRGDDQQGVYIY